MSLTVLKHFGKGNFKLFDEMPIANIELYQRRFQTIPDISLAEKLIWKSSRPQN